MRVRSSRKKHQRTAVAATELAVLLPFLLLLLSGVWEVGRMVQAQQIIANAVREGGREASAGLNDNPTICQNVANYLTMDGLSGVVSQSLSGNTTSGSATMTLPSTTGVQPGQSVTGTGIPTGTTVVSVNGPNEVTLSQAATATGSSSSVVVGNVALFNVTNSSRNNPQSANQLDQFRLTVSVPYSSIRWSALAQITTARYLTYSADWFSMKDSSVSVTTTIPTN